MQPADPDAWHFLGVIALQTGRAEQAVALIEKAVARQPDHAEAHDFNLGNALRALKRHADAVASYDLAIALRPDVAEPYFNRGNALRDLKRDEAAVANYDMAIALARRFSRGTFRARQYVLRNLLRHDAAIDSYDRAIALEVRLCGGAL